jgi:hypothetical protein
MNTAEKLSLSNAIWGIGTSLVNVADASDRLVTDRARRDLGWDAGFRMTHINVSVA